MCRSMASEEGLKLRQQATGKRAYGKQANEALAGQRGNWIKGRLGCESESLRSDSGLPSFTRLACRCLPCPTGLPLLLLHPCGYFPARSACRLPRGPGTNTRLPLFGQTSLFARAHARTMTDTEYRPAERFEQLVRIWRALSPTRQARWTRRVLALGTRPGLMDRIAIAAAAMPSVPASLASLGLDFFRELHQQARLKHRGRTRRLADDDVSYRAGADTRQASPRAWLARDDR